MKKIISTVACVAMAFIMFTPCHAEEPFVQILDAYTTDDGGVETSEFQVWDAVCCHIEFSISGKPDKYYKVVGMTGTLGDESVFQVKLPPGNYTQTTVHLVTDAFGPGTIQACQYKIKLKKRQSGSLVVMDTDSAMSEITIVE